MLDFEYVLWLEDEVMEELPLQMYDPATDDVIEHTFGEYRGKFLVLFFYPADFTFVCPTELKDLNKVVDALRAQWAEVLAASTDTVYTHKRWIETEKLLEGFGIRMISDRTCELSELFGVYNATTWNSERGTFIINPDGVIKSVEIVTEPIWRSSTELVRKVEALNYVRSNPGSACPVSWNQGGQAIQPGIKIAGKVGETYGDN